MTRRLALSAEIKKMRMQQRRIFASLVQFFGNILGFCAMKENAQQITNDEGVNEGIMCRLCSYKRMLCLCACCAETLVAGVLRY